MSGSTSGDAGLPPEIFQAPGAYPSTPGDARSSPTVSRFTLAEAVERRRAEFTRQCATKIKVGSWNVAALSGTEKDIAGWFIGGRGLSNKLSGVAIQASAREDGAVVPSDSAVEDPRHQEERQTKKKSTIPQDDIAYVPGDTTIGIYALGLQEIVNIGSATEAIRPYSDPHPAKKWRQAVEGGLPSGYQLIAEQQLIGLLLLIYASPEIAPQVSHVSTTNVGTGAMGFMGNKGAVTARIVLGDTTRMVFVNSHLGAGTEKTSLDRRNWDAQQIVSRTKFEAIPVPSGLTSKDEAIGDEDFAFWFGDLNYRLDDIPGEDVRRLLQVHTKKEYEHPDVSAGSFGDEIERAKSPVVVRSTDDDHNGGISTSTLTLADSSSADLSQEFEPQPSSPLPDRQEDTCKVSDPASLQTTLQSLLPHDQLHKQMRAGRAFSDGWREGPINFLPTYKYDVGSIGMFDSSEKKRGPSWCDRILYRTKADRENFVLRVQEEAETQRRDQEVRDRGLDKAVEEAESVLFDYDPETDAADDSEAPATKAADPSLLADTHSGSKDRINLDVYTSHQRVLSSDHKPLDAVLSLVYDAVDPEAKARIHAEVARELDKAENEGRPVVTVVVDQSGAVESAPECVDFGHVKYDSHKMRSITVANTGRVPAAFSFAPRGMESGSAERALPDWLSLSFEDRSSGSLSSLNGLREITLQPGDTISIHLTLLIKDIALVRRLNEKVSSLEDVLILRVSNGRDHFIPLRGEWMRSSFGNSIEKLVKISEGGIRKLQHQRPHDPADGADEVKWSSPKGVFRLTEAIETLTERAVAEWGLIEEGSPTWPPWHHSGWPFEDLSSNAEDREPIKEGIREALDMDQALDLTQTVVVGSNVELEATAVTLVDFLASLEDGIVPANLWAEIDVEISALERSKAPSESIRLCFLEKLQALPAHSVSMTFVLVMLDKITDEIVQASSFAAGARQEQPQQSEKIREGRERRYGEIFGTIVIRAAEVGKERERRLSEQRRKWLMEILIRGLRN